jgi:hypothetical protein
LIGFNVTHGFGENLAPVEAGCEGELIIGGSQLASGYLSDNPRTRRDSSSIATSGAPEGPVAFAHYAQVDEKQMLAECKRYLAPYAVPARSVAIDEVPLNVNGKVDRNTLVKMLDTATQRAKVVDA